MRNSFFPSVYLLVLGVGLVCGQQLQQSAESSQERRFLLSNPKVNQEEKGNEKQRRFIRISETPGEYDRSRLKQEEDGLNVGLSQVSRSTVPGQRSGSVSGTTLGGARFSNPFNSHGTQRINGVLEGGSTRIVAGASGVPGLRKNITSGNGLGNYLFRQNGTSPYFGQNNQGYLGWTLPTGYGNYNWGAPGSLQGSNGGAGSVSLPSKLGTQQQQTVSGVPFGAPLVMGSAPLGGINQNYYGGLGTIGNMGAILPGSNSWATNWLYPSGPGMSGWGYSPVESIQTTEPHEEHTTVYSNGPVAVNVGPQEPVNININLSGHEESSSGVVDPSNHQEGDHHAAGGTPLAININLIGIDDSHLVPEIHFNVGQPTENYTVPETTISHGNGEEAPKSPAQLSDGVTLYNLTDSTVESNFGSEIIEAPVSQFENEGDKEIIPASAHQDNSNDDSESWLSGINNDDGVLLKEPVSLNDKLNDTLEIRIGDESEGHLIPEGDNWSTLNQQEPVQSATEGNEQEIEYVNDGANIELPVDGMNGENDLAIPQNDFTGAVEDIISETNPSDILAQANLEENKGQTLEPSNFELKAPSSRPSFVDINTSPNGPAVSTTEISLQGSGEEDERNVIVQSSRFDLSPQSAYENVDGSGPAVGNQEVVQFDHNGSPLESVTIPAGGTETQILQPSNEMGEKAATMESFELNADEPDGLHSETVESQSEAFGINLGRNDGPEDDQDHELTTIEHNPSEKLQLGGYTETHIDENEQPSSQAKETSSVESISDGDSGFALPLETDRSIEIEESDTFQTEHIENISDGNQQVSNDILSDDGLENIHSSLTESAPSEEYEVPSTDATHQWIDLEVEAQGQSKPVDEKSVDSGEVSRLENRFGRRVLELTSSLTLSASDHQASSRDTEPETTNSEVKVTSNEVESQPSATTQYNINRPPAEQSAQFSGAVMQPEEKFIESTARNSSFSLNFTQPDGFQQASGAQDSALGANLTASIQGNEPGNDPLQITTSHQIGEQIQTTIEMPQQQRSKGLNSEQIELTPNEESIKVDVEPQFISQRGQTNGLVNNRESETVETQKYGDSQTYESGANEISQPQGTEVRSTETSVIEGTEVRQSTSQKIEFNEIPQSDYATYESEPELLQEGDRMIRTTDENLSFKRNISGPGIKWESERGQTQPDGELSSGRGQVPTSMNNIQRSPQNQLTESVEDIDQSESERRDLVEDLQSADPGGEAWTVQLTPKQGSEEKISHGGNLMEVNDNTDENKATDQDDFNLQTQYNSNPVHVVAAEGTSWNSSGGPAPFEASVDLPQQHQVSFNSTLQKTQDLQQPSFDEESKRSENRVRSEGPTNLTESDSSITLIHSVESPLTEQLESAQILDASPSDINQKSLESRRSTKLEGDGPADLESGNENNSNLNAARGINESSPRRGKQLDLESGTTPAIEVTLNQSTPVRNDESPSSSSSVQINLVQPTGDGGQSLTTIQIDTNLNKSSADEGTIVTISPSMQSTEANNVTVLLSSDNDDNVATVNVVSSPGKLESETFHSGQDLKQEPEIVDERENIDRNFELPAGSFHSANWGESETEARPSSSKRLKWTEGDRSVSPTPENGQKWSSGHTDAVEQREANRRPAQKAIHSGSGRNGHWNSASNGKSPSQDGLNFSWGTGEGSPNGFVQGNGASRYGNGEWSQGGQWSNRGADNSMKDEGIIRGVQDSNRAERYPNTFTTHYDDGPGRHVISQSKPGILIDGGDYENRHIQRGPSHQWLIPESQWSSNVPVSASVIHGDGKDSNWVHLSGDRRAKIPGQIVYNDYPQSWADHHEGPNGQTWSSEQRTSPSATTIVRPIKSQSSQVIRTPNKQIQKSTPNLGSWWSHDNSHSLPNQREGISRVVYPSSTTDSSSHIESSGLHLQDGVNTGVHIIPDRIVHSGDHWSHEGSNSVPSWNPNNNGGWMTVQTGNNNDGPTRHETWNQEGSGTTTWNNGNHYAMNGHPGISWNDHTGFGSTTNSQGRQQQQVLGNGGGYHENTGGSRVQWNNDQSSNHGEHQGNHRPTVINRVSSSPNDQTEHIIRNQRRPGTEWSSTNYDSSPTRWVSWNEMEGRRGQQNGNQIVNPDDGSRRKWMSSTETSPLSIVQPGISWINRERNPSAVEGTGGIQGTVVGESGSGRQRNVEHSGPSQSWNVDGGQRYQWINGDQNNSEFSDSSGSQVYRTGQGIPADYSRQSSTQKVTSEFTVPEFLRNSENYQLTPTYATRTSGGSWQQVQPSSNSAVTVPTVRMVSNPVVRSVFNRTVSVPVQSEEVYNRNSQRFVVHNEGDSSENDWVINRQLNFTRNASNLTNDEVTFTDRNGRYIPRISQNNPQNIVLSASVRSGLSLDGNSTLLNIGKNTTSVRNDSTKVSEAKEKSSSEGIIKKGVRSLRRMLGFGSSTKDKPKNSDKKGNSDKIKTQVIRENVEETVKVKETAKA